MDILLIVIAVVLLLFAYNLWFELYEFYHLNVNEEIKK